MAVSSVGAGSGILTQDVIDQLREADEAQFVRPVELALANEDDRKNALTTIDANMTNLIDSINALKDPALFTQRSATVSGTAVEVTAAINSDTQDFSLEVTKLATKQIEQSGTFTSNTETIANGVGVMNLNIDGTDYAIDYDATTTLDDLKNLINDVAGEKVDATVVQVATGDFRLFVSSTDTGTTQNITMTDKVGSGEQLKDTRLTSDVTAIQTGENAEFTFNGQAITRTSNTIDDLVTGLSVTLKEVGTSNVSIAQDSEQILEKIESFVSKYNESLTEIASMTKSSLDSAERGIFSSDSTIKSMQTMLTGMISSTGSGSMFNFGFDTDKEGRLSIDATAFSEQLENNNDNVTAFFTGGTYTNEDGSTSELEGAFNEYAGKVETYTKYDAVLDQLSKSITEKVSTLEDEKTTAIERLDSKYEIMKQRFIAFDIMMSRINSASSMFSQMVSAQNAADS